MLPRTSEGQKGAVAVVGILNMPGYPLLALSRRQRFHVGLHSFLVFVGPVSAGLLFAGCLGARIGLCFHLLRGLSDASLEGQR